MTELMKQLQQWANEELYIFPCDEYPKGTFKDWGLVSTKENDFSLCGTVAGYVYRVLDGTIQVWRPVKHYKPKNNENVLLFDPTHTDEYGEPLTTVIGYYREEDSEFHRFEIYRNGMSLMSPTHWQPLPQPPQKGGE